MRRAFATYCFNTKGINLEDAAAGLDHADTSVTERVYVGMEARQQRGNETLAQFRRDFLDLKGEVAGLKSDISDMKNHFSSVLNAVPEFGQPEFGEDSEDMDMMTQAFLLEHGVDENAALYKAKVNPVKAQAVKDYLDSQKAKEEVAPSRFELESCDPESQMMDRYTKGL